MGSDSLWEHRSGKAVLREKGCLLQLLIFQVNRVEVTKQFGVLDKRTDPGQSAWV